MALPLKPSTLWCMLAELAKLAESLTVTLTVMSDMLYPTSMLHHSLENTTCLTSEAVEGSISTRLGDASRLIEV